MELGRYNVGARWYDVLSGERLVYRRGREAGLRAVRPAPGERVLDLGCGTGLNFPALVAAVGDGGTVVGVDRSVAMIRRARRRCAERDWDRVSVVRADAADLIGVGAEPFDLVVATYSLSIVADWQCAVTQALDRLRPGGRFLVVDLALPVGRWRALWPLARVACWTGGVDPYRAPWRFVAEQLHDVGQLRLRGGHVHVLWGTKP